MWIFPDKSKKLNFQDFAALKLFAKWCDLITRETMQKKYFQQMWAFLLLENFAHLTSHVVSFAKYFA